MFTIPSFIICSFKFFFLHIFYCFTLVPETDLQFYNRNSHGNTTIFWKKIVQSNREINHFSIYCVKSILHFTLIMTLICGIIYITSIMDSLKMIISVKSMLEIKNATVDI